MQDDLDADRIERERARPETFSDSPSRSDALLRADAEHYRIDVEQLFQLTAAINRAAGVEAVHSIALRALCETLNVDRAAILLLDPDGVMRFKAWRGLSDRYRDAVEGHTPWALDDPDPQPVTVRDAAADPTLASYQGLLRDEDIHALAFIPLIDQRLWGKLMVYSREARAFTQREMAHAQVIASLISQALARAQLLEAERWARGQAELAQKRTAFLLEASIALSSSLEFHEALERVAHLAVPRFADWCAVDYSPEGPSSIHHVALVHRDPAKRLIDEQIRQLYPVTDATGNSLGNVIATGKSQLYAFVTDDLLMSSARDERHLEMLRSLAITSVVLAPMVARGRTYGVFTFVRSDPDRPFGPGDLEIAELLGRRAGIAIDTALLYKEAQDVAEAREEILRIVSHDLRNPLSAILSSTSGLLTTDFESVKPDRLKRALEIIHRGGMRMTRMIEDLLDAASIRAGRLSIRREPTEVAGIVADVVENFTGDAKTRNVSIRTELSEALPEVSVDRERIVQALSNLVSNALNVLTAGGIVVIRAHRDQETVVFNVSDTGPGIDSDDLPRVFERFWRNSKRGGRGTGLGLSIAKGLIEMHGGRIWVDSTPGAGSTFSFSVPVNIGREAATPA